MLIDHELYRRENWEALKQFRSKYDNEYVLSESILDPAELTSLKKDVDKNLLNAIRVCILKEDTEKVFSYMDMLYFSQSLKLCVRLCEQLKVPQLAEKVEQFILTRETKEKFEATQHQT